MAPKKSKAAARKPAAKTAAKKKAAPKKAVARKKKAAEPKARKPAKAAAKPAAKSSSARSRSVKEPVVGTRDLLAFGQPVHKGRRLNPWMKKQHMRLLALKDTLLDSMTGVARDNLRSGSDSQAVSAHGLHQADAGSDAYDRDFALNLLSQEQDALFEIDEALKRLLKGSYGVCEMSGKPIPKARLEARPFARFTVECQNEIERKNRFSRLRQPVGRLFDTVEDDSSEEGDDDTSSDSKE